MVKDSKYTTEWRDKTLKLLRERPRNISFFKIHQATGLGEAWLSMLQRGKITNPTINMMNALFNYLSSIKR